MAAIDSQPAGPLLAAEMPDQGPAEEPLLSADFARRLEQLDIRMRRTLFGRSKGDRRSRRRGRSVEFADHKPYADGDDLRHLDWSIYARLERLVVKLFQEEEDLRLHLLLDVSASMDYGVPSKHLFARRLAAALGYVALSAGNRVAVHPFADRLMAGTGLLRGRMRTAQLVDVLSDLPIEESGGDIAAVMRTFAATHSGAGVVVVISDFMDRTDPTGGLRFLQGLRCDAYVLHVLAEQELRPDLLGDLRLEDREGAGETEVTISAPLLAAYRRALEEFTGGLRTACTRRGLTYVLAGAGSGFEPLVLNVLRRQGLVH